MAKERTAKEVYEELSNKGDYEEAHLDKDEITRVKDDAFEDYSYGLRLCKEDNPNWRVIFSIHYDALRQLCDQLMRFKEQKISNHQGLFAFIVLEFPELELDWKFFETVRAMRNNHKYKGKNVTEKMWKQISFQMNLYLSSLKKEIERKVEVINQIGN